MSTLHIHGQQIWHDCVTIIGTPEALVLLRDLITKAIEQGNSSNSRMGDDGAIFTSDGEGYFINVLALSEDDEKWENLIMPYHDPDIYKPQNDELCWTGSHFVKWG